MAVRWSVPALYFAGILATFAREIVLAASYGTGVEIETFRLAFAVPNLLSTSLGPAFVAAVMPALMSAGSEGSRLPETMRQVVAVNVLAVVLVTVVAVVTAPLQARMLAPGYSADATADLSSQMALMWLFFLFAGCSFSLRAFLGQRIIFWPAAGASVVGSGTIALGCLVAVLTSPEAMRGSAGFLTALAVLSGVLILCMHLVALPRGTLTLFRFRAGELTRTFWSGKGIAGAVLIVATYHLLSAVPRMIDRAVATTIGDGVVAALEYSFSLITVPGILLGTSMVTMLFPGFSKAVETGSAVPANVVLRPVLTSLALASVVGATMSAQASNLVETVFMRGSFDASAAEMTAEFVRWHGLGLPFMVATIILAQAALAFRDYRLVLTVAGARILTKWAAVHFLVPASGISGLAASLIVPELVSAVILALALRLRLRNVLTRGEAR